MLPSGEVTFLFTDIEGSTQRWDRDRDAMQAAVRRHDAILRDVIERHGGSVFKTIGDAFCAAFPSAADAVHAALTAQRELAQTDFSAIDGLRVRMALHSGTADERDNDYFGPSVNRVARLLAIGHGEQVLLSQACAEQVRDRLEGGAQLLDLGRHRLKDIAQPESVFQLLAPGLPDAFPPLRSLEALRGNLPQQLTSFVGRASDVETLRALVRAHRLVTLTGTGGVGKSRLAIQVATLLADEFSDGAWFVPLAPLADPAQVVGTLAATFGLRESLNRPMLDTLTTFLKNKRLLVVLDNCEHVLSVAASTVATLMQSCAGVTVLATSRAPLDIAGEQRHRLAELSVPPDGADAAEASAYGSVQLFVARAHEANARFAFTDDTAPTVVRVCARLDGIALAIELAAARLKTVSLDVLDRHLDDRFRVLTGGNRAAQPRQQTLRALIEWSYDLLDPSEQDFFVHLAPFAGGATVTTLLAMQPEGGLDEWALCDRLASLVEKSLLVVDGEGESARYRFLESIRAYARERLAADGEAADTWRRFARAFATVADGVYQDFDGGARPHWIEKAALELDNVRAALAWSLDHDPVLAARIAGGYGVAFLRMTLLREGTEWCERALSRAHNLDAPILARLEYVRSMLCNNQARYAEALVAAERALEAFRRCGDARGETRALSQVAQQLLNNDRRDEALTIGERALAAARTLGDPAVLATTLARCANALGADSIERARGLYDESARLWDDLGRMEDRQRVLWWWVVAEFAAGCDAQAAEILEQLLPATNGELRMWVSNAAMTVYWLLGDRPRAVAVTREALALAVAGGSRWLAADALNYVAMIVADADPAEAVRLLAFAERRFNDEGYTVTHREAAFLDSFTRAMRARLSSDAYASARREGSAWSDTIALARASSHLAL